MTGMSVRDADCAEEWGEFAVRVLIARSEGHGSLAVFDQVAGCRANRGEPIGNIMGIAD